MTTSINTIQTIETIKKVKLSIDNVERIYVGKPGMCYCGCSGKYTEKTELKKITRLFNKLTKDEQIFRNLADECFTKQIGNTEYTIYLTK